MTESHVVSGLVAKRAEIVGQIDAFQSEIARLQGAISHLDGSIKLFAPSYDLRTIKGKRTNQRNQYLEHGEGQRFTLDILRTGGNALCSREITDQVIERKGSKADSHCIAQIQKNILVVMHRLEDRNMAISYPDTVNGRDVLKWKLV
jgi:hypothetical protein